MHAPQTITAATGEAGEDRGAAARRLVVAAAGVKNAMTRHDFGLINKWLRYIKDVYRANSHELEALPAERRFDRLVELNVSEQVQNLAQTTFIQHAWHTENRPHIHGWVYDLRTGTLKEIAMMTPDSQLEPIYRFEFPDEPAAGG